METLMKFDWHYSVKQWLTLPGNQKLKQAKVKLYDFEECKNIWKEEKVIMKRRPILAKNVCAGPPHIFEVVYWIISNFWCKTKHTRLYTNLENEYCATKE